MSSKKARIPLKNKKLQSTEDRALRYLQGESANYLHCISLSYYQVPGLNLNRSPWIDRWNAKNAMDLYQPFPWHCDYPKPIIPPARLPRSVLCGGDPGLELLLTKKYIEQDVKAMTKRLKKRQKDLLLPQKRKKFPSKKEGSSMELPKCIADLAEVIDMDPDPDFNGRYNYYFNGGTLENIVINGANILVFPYAKELIAVPLITTDTSMWKPLFPRAAKSDLPSQVFDLRHTVFSNGHRIMARMKHECAFYNLTQKGDKLRMQSLSSCHSKSPFITADLNPFEPRECCTISINNKIKVRDVVSHKIRSEGKLPMNSALEDKWRSVRYHKWSPHIVTVADRCCIHYLDLRESINTPVLSMCPKSYIDEFEQISLEIPSEREARHYVATYLSLLMFDSRYPEASVRQKWTHQLQSAPITANVLPHEGKEIITLSTQLIGDTKIVLNTWEDLDEPHNFHLPYTPPSILDTLRECHFLGDCLDPLLKTQLRLSTAGSQLIHDDSQNVYFLTQNSIGDIFYQGINYNEVLDKNSYVNTSAYYALKVWNKRRLMQNNCVAPLVLSDQANMKTVFDSFSNKDLKYKPRPKVHYNERDYLEEEEKKKKKRRKKSEPSDNAHALAPAPAWKQSIGQLSRYVDLLAPSLLAVWEVTEPEGPIPQAGSAQKVLNWLENTTEETISDQLTQDSIKIEDDDCCVLTPVNTQELVSVSQLNEAENINDNGQSLENSMFVDDEYFDDDLSYLPFKTVKKPRISTKKSRFIDGF